MFHDIGGRLKRIAATVCAIEVAFNVLASIVLFVRAANVEGDERTVLILIGVAVLCAGSFLAWLGSLLLAGFGQLLEDSRFVAEMAEQKMNTAFDENKEPALNQKAVAHRWKCPQCNQAIAEWPCPYCGQGDL